MFSVTAGHPIVNDPLYGHPAWGPRCGRGGEGVGNMEQVYTCMYVSVRAHTFSSIAYYSSLDIQALSPLPQSLL